MALESRRQREENYKLWLLRTACYKYEMRRQQRLHDLALKEAGKYEP